MKIFQAYKYFKNDRLPRDVDLRFETQQFLQLLPC